MAEKLRIGLIGLGWVGTARHLPAITANPVFDFVGVADRSDGKADTIARKHRLRASTAATLAEIEWIDEVDAVSIATAPMAHHDLVCEALERGLHVITEKPFAMDVAQGEAMVRTAEMADRRLAVVHNFQFARSMKRLRQDLESGKLGDIRGIRAIQLGNPSRRLPTWFEELPLGLFYDESPHLLYLVASIAGPLKLTKAICTESRHERRTPAQIDCWFETDGAKYPITLSCNFESSLSEWHVSVHGEKGVAIVDVFRDIYLHLPNDGSHGTREVLGTSLAASAQHWWQHLTSGIPHLTGKLRYGNNEVFARFAAAILGDRGALAPISADKALQILSLQHDIIAQSERLYG